MLLIGVDRRGTKGDSNTDAMLIATIDTVNNRLKLTTIMRDMLVNIPGHGYGKLNSAAVKGGLDLLFETLNNNFYLNLSEYVLVDFNMFEEIVDALGGVTVRMSAEGKGSAGQRLHSRPQQAARHSGHMGRLHIRQRGQREAHRQAGPGLCAAYAT